MNAEPKNIALLYDESAYVETVRQPSKPQRDRPAGLMGRQVAGRQFLDAYLTHGSWNRLTAVVRNGAESQSLTRFCESHPSSRARQRRLAFCYQTEFHESFLRRPPARLLYAPCPPDAGFAWARSYSNPGSFALSGVTHTLCSAAAVRMLCELVTAPFEPYDALICTSRAVEAMVRSITGAYSEHLRERHGGAPGIRIQLKTIPLGVDPQRYRPATAEERAEQRRTLGVGDEEIVVLFVGRLAHHAKAHPFPMYRGIAEAARSTGKTVRLILAGWTANPEVREAFEAGARVFAPNVRTTIVDGADPDVRFAIWHAADLFTSLSDNIQETFGLVIVEAMACGLPVVASDWNGYRDLVAPNETGFLIPTLMVRDATADATSKLLTGQTNYDHFLAECSQSVTVDVSEAARAYARLFADPQLRRKMGAEGRRRALERLTWRHVIGAYEELWQWQQSELPGVSQRSGTARPAPGPAFYPAPDHSFAGYPTAIVGPDDRLQTVRDACDLMETLLALPLTHHEARVRCSDAATLRKILMTAREPQSLGSFDRAFVAHGIEYQTGRATVAWMLKYGLLAVVPDTRGGR